MHTKEKIKMCPCCEGSIPIESLECRYCGSALNKNTNRKMAYQTEDSLASLYEPPYAPNRKSAQVGIASDNIYTYEEQEEDIDELPEMVKKKVTAKQSVFQDDEEEERSSIGALLLLSIGANLFTLAWLQFFFSDHGVLTLEWKSRYWPIYFLVSLPFVYHGYKKL